MISQQLLVDLILLEYPGFDVLVADFSHSHRPLLHLFFDLLFQNLFLFVDQLLLLCLLYLLLLLLLFDLVDLLDRLGGVRHYLSSVSSYA